MATLPTDRDTSDSAADHVTDHNTLHAVNNILDAKGDLPCGTAADTWARLPVGTNGHVLTADSGETTGLKWAAQSGTSALAGVKVYQSSAQSVNSATQTVLTWDAEEFDTDAFHSLVTNTGRLTVPSGMDGYYLFGANLSWSAPLTDQARTFMNLNKNGSLIRGGRSEGAESGTTAEPTPFCSVLVYLAATDYVEVQVYQNVGSARSISTSATAAWLYRVGT